MLSRVSFLDDKLPRLDFPLVDAVDDLPHLRRVEILEKIVVRDRISDNLFRPVATHDNNYATSKSNTRNTDAIDDPVAWASVNQPVCL